MNYTELVKSLRICGDFETDVRFPGKDGCDGCAYHDEVNDVCNSWDADNRKENIMLQAADAIEQLQKDLERSKEYEAFWEKEANEALRKFQVAIASKPRWIPVTERLPENNVHVLLSCKHGTGTYICDGFHTEKYSTPTMFYEDIDADYDEEADEYYFPEGWWEVIKNWDDYSCVWIEDAVTHWMPLPVPPKEERKDPCADCVHYPPSSTDGKPCCACDPDDPLMNCFSPKEENNG